MKFDLDWHDYWALDSGVVCWKDFQDSHVRALGSGIGVSAEGSDVGKVVNRGRANMVRLSRAASAFLRRPL